MQRPEHAPSTPASAGACGADGRSSGRVQSHLRGRDTLAVPLREHKEEP